MSEEDRFWSKVEGAGECWLWMAAKRGNGYGCFKFRGRLASTHRVAFTLIHGELSDEQVVMHSCDNRACVNPDHLSPGTRRDNTQDAIEKGRHSMPPLSHLRLLGEDTSHHKLTSADVRQIRQSHITGLGYRRLAAAYGVDRRTIAKIIKGETWSHLAP